MVVMRQKIKLNVLINNNYIEHYTKLNYSHYSIVVFSLINYRFQNMLGRK